MVAFSIPATEHSTMTSWGGREGEVKAMENVVDKFAGKGRIYACVSDSYDIYNAIIQHWGTTLRHKIQQAGGTLVVRPDSGDPIEVTLRCVKLLGEKFGHSVNEKGYKVLNPCVRLIQGDGIDGAMIEKILQNFAKNGWSADNIAFGCGGGLLQKVDRDTQKFAMKCSAMKVNGEWIDVFKDPITDKVKKSKKGRLMLYKNLPRNTLLILKVKIFLD
jgi:nicotinamide phosphoribosyltransferase